MDLFSIKSMMINITIVILVFLIMLYYYFRILKTYSGDKYDTFINFLKKINKYINTIQIYPSLININSFKIIGYDTYTLFIFSKLSLSYLTIIIILSLVHNLFEDYFNSIIYGMIIYFLYFIFIEHLSYLYKHCYEVISKENDTYNNSIFIKLSNKSEIENMEIIYNLNLILGIENSFSEVKIVNINNYKNIINLVNKRNDWMLINTNYKRSYCFFKYFIHNIKQKKDGLCLYYLDKYDKKLSLLNNIEFDKNNKCFYLFFNKYELLYKYLKKIKFNKTKDSFYDNYFRSYIKMYPFVKSWDIQWNNLYGNKRIKLLKRVLLTILICCIFIFISTPVVLLQYLEIILKNEYIDLDIKKLINLLPDNWVFLIENYLLSSLIVISNLIILVIIDKIFKLHEFIKFSTFQIKVFQSSSVHIIINILIIPALSFSASYSIFENFINNTLDFKTIIQKLSEIRQFKFYYYLLFQTLLGQIIYNLIMLSHLASNKYSYTLIFQKRKEITKQKWKKKIEDLFQMGYYGMLLNLYFSIIFIFGYLDFELVVMVYFYILLMSLVYLVNIFFFHKEEIFSNGLLQLNIIRFLNTIFVTISIIYILWSLINRDILSLRIIIYVFLLFLKLNLWYKFRNNLNTIVKHTNNFDKKSNLIRKGYYK